MLPQGRNQTTIRVESIIISADNNLKVTSSGKLSRVAVKNFREFSL